ncbi:MAG: WecB/TagA/CpsF family glycosyltransferase [Candidatus Portnoybacteria bacterium]|nr:WecB/TagA/CpsF family glycosyltransferase [Candidatus Portnoybacteria bacterium]
MLKLLGVPLEQLSRSQVITRIKDSKTPFFIVTVNPEILLHAWRNNEYSDTLKSADMRVVDGFGIVLMARLLYRIKLERFPGADLAEEILRIAAQRKWRVFLLGGSEEVNEWPVKRFKTLPSQHSAFGGKYDLRFKNVAGLGGRFSEKEAIEKITKFKPDILFVALGAPKQELFIHNILKSNILNRKSIAIGIGGAIDYWAYPWLRAPYIVRRIGFEWLWRVILQPWRLPRILKAVFVFPFACVYERILLQWQNENH